MIGLQLKKERYQHVYADLMQNAHNTPLCPICEVGLVLNGESYALFLLPERHGWVYALYALHCVYEKDVNAVNHTLITDNALLSALMEIVIYQGGKRRLA